VNSLIDEQMENAIQEAAAAKQHPTVLVAAVVGSVVGGEAPQQEVCSGCLAMQHVSSSHIML
jgi:hypothetical protein